MKLTFRRGMAGVATAALTLGVAVTASPAFAANGDSDEFVMYVTNWGDKDVAKQLHDTGVANYLTTINYAFSDVAPANLTRAEASGHPDIPGSGTGSVAWEDYDEAVHGPIVCKPTDPDVEFFEEYDADESLSGRAESTGLIGQLALLKQMHPQIKFLPSLGGATLSKWFSLASLTEESRATLIDSCIDLWIDGNYSDDEFGDAEDFAGLFDGVDIDWEFPAFVGDDGVPVDRSGNDLSIDANDAENYNLLAKEFRIALEEALDGPALVTAATPASPWTGDGYDFPGLAEHLDWFSVMAYDLHGTWEDRIGNGAGITDYDWGVANTVNMYLDKGVDPSKIVLGVPFYGPAWTDVEVTDDGSFYMPNPGPDLAWLDTIPVPATPLRSFNWNEIVQLLADNPELEIEWDEEYGASYIYDAASSTYYSFDNEQAIQTKIQDFVLELGLRGVMVWEFGGDTADAQLSHLIIDELGLPYVETVPLPELPEEPEVPEVPEPETPEIPDDGATPITKQPSFTG